MSAEMERLRQRLVACRDAYAKPPGGRSDDFKRKAIQQALAAVIEFIEVQPNWRGLSAHLAKMHWALHDIENGSPVSWLSLPEGTTNHSDPHNIALLKAEAAARMELLVNPANRLYKMSRENAGKEVLKKIPGKQNSRLFDDTNANWETIDGWRYKYKKMPIDSIERQYYDAFLRVARETEAVSDMMSDTGELIERPVR